MNLRTLLCLAAGTVLTLSLAACGGGSSAPAPVPPATYTIGGTLSGLTPGAGISVVLQDNGKNNLPLSNNGTFAFTFPVTTGTPYAVTVLTQPTGQTCTVANGTGSGVVANANVTNISVMCAVSAGTASGLKFPNLLPSNQSSRDTLHSNTIVEVDDANGNVVTSSTATITVIVVGPPPFTTVKTSKAAVGGVATFDLSSVALSLPGLYTLTATSSGLTSANQIVGVNQVLVPPQQTVYTGAFYNPSGSSPSPNPGSGKGIEVLEGQIGRTLATDMHYYGWAKLSSFPAKGEEIDLQNHRIPVISWECYHSSGATSTDLQVASGQQDSEIVAAARAIKQYGGPIFLRWFWEMNILPLSPSLHNNYYCMGGESYSGGYHDVAETNYRAAWDHIRSIFAQQGVTNVIWLWNPDNGFYYPSTDFYPGNNQVDWIGVDAYAGDGETFKNTFSSGSGYAMLAAMGKPILIGETGSADGTNGHPDDQPTFFGAAVAQLGTGVSGADNGYPDFLGFMYFDSPGNGGPWPFSSDGIVAYKTMVNQPYLSAMNLTSSAFPYTTYPFDTYIHFVPEQLQGIFIPVTVTVDGLNGSTPTGTVTIYEGANLELVLELTPGLGFSSTATGTLSGLPSGTDTLVALYSGDSNNPKGQSGAFTVNIN